MEEEILIVTRIPGGTVQGLKKNLNASKASDIPPIQEEKLSKCFHRNVGCKKKTLRGI